MKKIANILVILAMTVAGAAMAQTAEVQVIHNSPDPGAAVVDIYINKDLAIPGFGFREATPVLSLDAGVSLVIGVAPDGSMGPDEIIAEFPVMLESGGSYVVMATGVLDPGLPQNPEGIETGFTLNIFAPASFSAPMGEVGLLAYHGAPDAPTVDVVAMGVGTLFGSLSYGAFDGYLNVPAADYNLQVTLAGMPGEVVATYMAPLSGLGGGAAVVFASGYLSGRLDGFGLFAALADGTVLELPDGSTATAELSLGELKSLY